MRIRIENLRKRYGTTVAVDIPTLDIERGEFLGLLGNNGAGKTTFLRLLLDLIAPECGRVLIEGLDVRTNTRWKAATSSFLDNSFLIPFLRPEEYAHFVGAQYGYSAEEIDSQIGRYRKLLTDPVFGTGKLIRHLSTGNAHKLGLIVAMCVRPRLLVLDEPFANLDPTSQLYLKETLSSMSECEHTTIVISSHHLKYVTDLCKRIVIVERGRISKDFATDTTALSTLERYFTA